jgi:hypothetical protein
MDENDPSKQHPMLYALLTALQLTALGLCCLVLMNMALDNVKSPVPECPIKAPTELPQ